MKTSNKPLFPFQKNLKGEPIDLSNDEDVSLVIKRNQTLQLAIESGLSPVKLQIKACIEIKFQCVKCGTIIEESHKADQDETGVWWNWCYMLNNVQCECCKTSYHYSERHQLVKASLPKEQLKLKKS